MPDRKHHKFLVCVDDTPECHVAMKFAALRAKRTGGTLTMLRVVEPAEFQHWIGVGNIMREEAFAEAERLMKGLSEKVHAFAEMTPELIVLEGDRKEIILKLIEEDDAIRILVLAAAPNDDPGPLVRSLAGKMAGSLRVPITVVPGTMTEQTIQELA